MSNIASKLKSIVSRVWAVPVVLLITTLLSYGMFFRQMGFYWDDLPISWIRYQLGVPAMTRYFSDSRPVWALLYQLTTYFIPQNPVYWQIFAMFWRWLDAVVVWAIMERLLPRRRNLAFILCLFTLVYPGFNQQAVSFLYAHFFIVIFFFLISWYLMLRKKVIPALVFSALNLWMFEYFFVLDLMRPLILWMSLRDEPLTLRERSIRVFREWVPYLIVFVLAVLSRLFIFNNAGFGYSLTAEIVKAPLATFVYLLRNIFFSLWTVTLPAWNLAFQLPNPLVVGQRIVVLYCLVVIIIGVLAYWFMPVQGDLPKGSARADAKWLIGLGIVMLLLSGVPFWFTNVPVSLGFPANRATLPFMLGSGFVFVGLLEFLPSRIKIALAVAFVAFAAGRQFLWSDEFRRDWTQHKNLFWQMTWRAPGLKKNTMVLVNEELAYYADNSLSAALNWIYSPNNRSDVMDYVLFYPTNRQSLSLELNAPVTFDYLAGTFKGNTSQAVVFYYSPPGCLRLLDPEIDSKNRLIPQETLMREAALLSSMAPILSESTARMPEIYGPEPAHNWCYFFEKADLARQMRDWKTVTHLGDVAFGLNDYPNDAVERFVFIEGYAHIGDWKKAVELSMDSYKVSRKYMSPLLCTLWDRIARDTESTPERNVTLDGVHSKLECSPQ